ncbi:MAG: hypothetical protein OIF58_08980 [Cohaesibacter sp.]|nr:hypothetical protein [Cohaesibacter sp.]
MKKISRYAFRLTLGSANPSIFIARAIQWAGYGLSFFIGATLWPRLIEWGFKHENTQFGLSLMLSGFCLPITMAVAWGAGWMVMQVATIFDHPQGNHSLERNVQIAAMMGVIAALGSCGMIAGGYEPPELLRSFYDLDLSSKYR